jgi:hypothetical protein
MASLTTRRPLRKKPTTTLADTQNTRFLSVPAKQRLTW